VIFDCHTHIFPPEIIENRSKYVGDQKWFSRLYGDRSARMASARGLVEEMDRCGVERAVACGFAWDDFDLYVRTNDYIADAVSRFPDRLVGFANVPPLHPRALEELERCAGMGLRGVGELKPMGQGFALDDTDALAPFAGAAAAHSLPLLIHVSEPVGRQYPGKGYTSPGKAYRFARRFPELRLIFAHWGGGLVFYELMPDVHQELANVFYDCSANPYLYDPGIFRLLMDSPAAGKILFASDYPLLKLDDCLGDVRDSGLADPAMEALMGGNAQELLGTA